MPPAALAQTLPKSAFWALREKKWILRGPVYQYTPRLLRHVACCLFPGDLELLPRDFSRQKIGVLVDLFNWRNGLIRHLVAPVGAGKAVDLQRAVAKFSHASHRPAQ